MTMLDTLARLEALYDTPPAELSDPDYLTLCIAHGVDWPGAGMRPYAFMKPRWLFCPERRTCTVGEPGWVATCR